MMMLPALLLDVCAGITIVSTPARHYWSDPLSQTFPYRAERRDAGPGQPWVIYLPGGPGQTSIGAAPPGPGAYNWILTDPRTQGCNAVAGIPDESLTSEALARDVLAIIKAQAIPTGYLIYGQSYGTVVATILASLAEADLSAPKPGAILLEGVNGRAARAHALMWPSGTSGVITPQQEEWVRIRSLILPAAIAELDATPPPLGFTAEQRGAYLYAILPFGDYPVIGNYVASQVNKLAGTPEDRGALQKSISSALAAPSREPIATQIRCRELWARVPTVTYSGGQIIGIGDSCAAAGLTLTPWDSKVWSVAKPIIYFEGERDSLTDPENAGYHFWSHYGAPRTFVYVRGGAGHLPLSSQMFYSGCRGSVWEGIVGHTNLKTAVQGCNLQADVYAAP